MRETRVQSLGQEDQLEKEMAIHSSTIAWKISWTEEPGRLQSMGSQSRRWLSDFTSLTLFCKLCSHFCLRVMFDLQPPASLAYKFGSPDPSYTQTLFAFPGRKNKKQKTFVPKAQKIRTPWLKLKSLPWLLTTWIASRDPEFLTAWPCISLSTYSSLEVC